MYVVEVILKHQLTLIGCQDGVNYEYENSPCVQSQPLVQDIITSDFECCIWEECAPPNTVVGPQRNVPLLSLLTHRPISTLIGPINRSKNE